MKTRRRKTKINKTTKRKNKKRRGGSAILSVFPYMYHSIYNVYHAMEAPISIQPWIY